MKYKTYSLNPDEEKTQFVLLCILCFFLICVTKFSLVISLASIVFVAIIYVISNRNLNRKYFEINFTEEQAEINYIKRNENIVICYSDIIQIRYIRYKNRGYNRLTYNHNAKPKKVSFLTVAEGDEYINFLKWFREKNIKTEFDAYPPDENMEYRIQENFGFKYRKFLKETL
jgi:hypothetical protein